MSSWVSSLLRNLGLDRAREDASALYGAVVAQSRAPVFYSRLEVPDTATGRFEMLSIHGFLVLHRLKTMGADAEPLSQALVETMFLDLDRSLREMGVGDLSVGKRMKKMAQAFYGRAAAYEIGLSSTAGEELVAAVMRNVYDGKTVDPGAASVIADYMRSSTAMLSGCDLEDLGAGRPAFATVEHRESALGS